ncbi:MAG: hypothetical protein R2698_13180 [Microthrixaceae bacterium]
MFVTHRWLAEMVPALRDHPVGSDPVALGDLMSSIGLCCDEVRPVGTSAEGIVVAEVLSLSTHPGADRIQLVEVDAGDGEALQICCGAFNMAVGDHVPLATLGATMPDGLRIERRKLRGEWSNGMLCSGRELGLGTDHSGILILDPSTTVGTPLAEALGLAGDVVFDLDVTPNRPDALSVLGVARDVAAALGLDFVAPDPRPEALLEQSGGGAGAVVRVDIRRQSAAGGSVRWCCTVCRADRAPDGCENDSSGAGCVRSTPWSTCPTT